MRLAAHHHVRGAIFCDGQYLASSNDPVSCADALDSSFGVDVDVTAATGGDAGGDGEFSCASAGHPAHVAWGVAALGATLALGSRRRRATP